MVKKDVDPKLEPILDKIEEFDPERADRLRDNYGKEPEECPVHGYACPTPHGKVPPIGRSVVTETTTSSDGLVISKHTVPVKRVPRPKGQQNYRVCTHCSKKGAYSSDNAEYCKYCHPRKAWKNVPVEPAKKSWLDRLLRR